MKKETQNTLALVLIGILIMLLPACKVVDIEGTQTVQKTYRIFHKEKVSVVKLKGLKGTFLFPTDTLKRNDVVNLKKLKP